MPIRQLKQILVTEIETLFAHLETLLAHLDNLKEEDEEVSQRPALSKKCDQLKEVVKLPNQFDYIGYGIRQNRNAKERAARIGPHNSARPW